MKELISYFFNRFVNFLGYFDRIQMTDSIMNERINNRITRRAIIMAIEEETQK